MSNGMDEVTSLGDCAGIPMDGGPVCESCGVPLVEHLGLIGTCAELQRVQKELAAWKASHVVLVEGMPGIVELLSTECPADRNYTEIEATADGSIEVVLTIQRRDRKTPHELRREAEAELQRVQKELSDLRNWKAGAVTASQALRIQKVGAELGVRSSESIEAARTGGDKV